jgi:hypothetical protein
MRVLKELLQKKIQRDEACERHKDNEPDITHRCILPVNFSVILYIYAARQLGGFKGRPLGEDITEE